MKLVQIINARQIIENISSDTMSSNLAYWLAKFVVKTQDEYNFYISKLRDITQKYATIENEKVIIPAVKTDEFNREIIELENTEVESPNIKISLSDLTGELKLSIKQMCPLLDFIDENK